MDDAAFLNWLLTNQVEENILAEHLAPPFNTPEHIATASTPTTTTTTDVSTAELFQYYLGDEIEQYCSNTLSSASPNTVIQQTPSPSPPQSQPIAHFQENKPPIIFEHTVVADTSNTHHPPSFPSQKSVSGSPKQGPFIGRMNFRSSSDDEAEVNKATNPKERRQLRNKISARKFRDRRKDYIASLEKEIEQYKQETRSLKLDVNWANSTMAKLQKENDELRMKLMLYEKGIMPIPAIESTNNSLLDSSIFLPLQPSNPLLGSFSSSSSSSSSSQSPPLIWQSDVDTMLSHALFPTWDMSRVIADKQAASGNQPSQAGSILQRYPLLGPALMSIVIDHSLNMNTEDILAMPQGTAEYPPSLKWTKASSPKEIESLWNMLQPPRSGADKEEDSKTAVDDENESLLSETETETGAETAPDNVAIKKEAIKSESKDKEDEDEDEIEEDLERANLFGYTPYYYCPIAWFQRNITWLICKRLHEKFQRCSAETRFRCNSNYKSCFRKQD
ncbi:HLH-domain-containing basic-leucine zipper transcription factor [Phycomyces blakesleeanus]|uniref:HLH-domain-containing basic-leucine zipper transcription factor n=2 Tax=Phycomyces blakesleeanus TaxID=4837 RepID=A0A162U465_PHYB8|nr:HLH-domain-containing basic-leucine zipper transcription factor [Phycomyces blakesleeanus NRRL 1555(-)]OAD73302.1 HLH-domain-containing basic-leucine zipper transcription factor [Phycomyces blakesleeanus NRRL 1555(-)]|eukprot:XP_018291342.1 HLH-domain-containing basic-leucine zipper transcription factor [Phycomyces blakesleeanus NRRL 1555(-)]